MYYGYFERSSVWILSAIWQACILASFRAQRTVDDSLGVSRSLNFLCEDTKTAGSSAARDVITDGDSSNVNAADPLATYQRRRAVKTIALRSLVICVATSLAIEVTQEITKLGMFNTNDIIANSIGSCIGIGMVWLWQHVVHPLDDRAVRCGGDITMRCAEEATSAS